MLKIVSLILFLGLIYCSVTPVDQTAFYTKLQPAVNFGIESGYVSQPYLTGEGFTFYQFVFKTGQTASTATNDDPIIIWLNGGPGCASQFGLYGEIGPFVITNTTGATPGFAVTIRPQSWNNQAHLLFVDQPFGAGLSYTEPADLKVVDNTDDSAAYFAEFLSQFFLAHPVLLKNKLYLFGESFAGHYIPAIGVQILNNKKLSALNFQGVGIGDAWISPINQLASFGPFLYSAGLVDDLRRNTAQTLSTNAQAAILQGNLLLGSKYFDQVTEDLLANYTGNISPYNFQVYPTDPAVTDPYEGFLIANKKTFNVPDNVTYQGCNPSIYANFQDIVQSRENDLIQILNSNKQVLIYNGQLDYIVNTAGALLWINQLKWSPIAQWKLENKQLFKVGTNIQGWYKIHKNFAFANIYQAGHMVPTDQPIAAYAMLQHYLNNDIVWQ